MFFAYSLLFYLLVLIFWPFILLAFVIKSKLRAGFWQKIGFYQNFKLSRQKTLWIHAVSVGEVNAVEGFVKSLKTEFPDFNIVISTVTRTGQDVATKKFANVADKIIYFPYDFIFSINQAIKAIKPEAVIVAETEIWPNFTNELFKKQIPIMIINGRISPNSYKGYKKISFFFRKILSKYSLILMQTQSDKDRIVDIGSPENKTKVMGNLKFDITDKIDANQIRVLCDELKTASCKVIIAGSTHAGEDEIVLDVYKKLKHKYADLKLLIAPRHPERNQSVLDLIKNTTAKYGLRSQNDNFENSDIIMLDTMGELGNLYSICDIAFIGGSFSGTGGHNPLEAAIYDKPTISGPTVFNFKDIYRYLTEAEASFIVSNQDELYDKIDDLLFDEVFYQQVSQKCKTVFDENSGALDYSIKELKELINHE
jgi:3-deoxy-D-manno-octulosonic-acid transferase